MREKVLRLGDFDRWSGEKGEVKARVQVNLCFDNVQQVLCKHNAIADTFDHFVSLLKSGPRSKVSGQG